MAGSQFNQMKEGMETTLGGSFQQMMAAVTGDKKGTQGVSTSQLWYVAFSYPAILSGVGGSGGHQGRGAFSKSMISHFRTLSLYASEVNTPTRQVTTGGVRNVGAEYKYATGTAFSETSIQFYIPRSYLNLCIFERWMQIMAPDSNQYVSYYHDYVAPRIYIYKLEQGGGPQMDINQFDKRIRQYYQGPDGKSIPLMNKVVAGWHLHNVFPKSVGTLQFSNQPGQLLTLDVSFSYERYRFYPDPKFDVRGKMRDGGKKKKPPRLT